MESSDDSFSAEVFEARKALSDSTNRPHKRDFSSFLSDSALKSANFAKKVCVEKRGNENKERDEIVVHELSNPNCGPTQRSAISDSVDSDFPRLQRCVALKGNGAASSNLDAGFIKDCTCFVCSTAGYIWSDLHYQDMKGRLTGLKKSQKEAAKMVQKILGEKENILHSQRALPESLKLELSLIDQWRSLFSHMESTLALESYQLESNFEKIKDLRESFKNEQEVIDKVSSHGH